MAVGGMGVPPRSERLAEIYRRLLAAPPASTAAEALQQLTDIINDVEAALTGIPYDPENWLHDGRIYPPQADSGREVEGRPNLNRYRTRRHNCYIAANGAIEIQRIDGAIDLTKAGADGRGVWGHEERD